MRRFLAFLTHMDARAWRMLGVTLVLFGGVGITIVFGARLLDLDGPRAVEGWLAAARGPWALPVATLAFVGLAFLGTPQIVLIAAAVVAFGPWLGAVYSWIAALTSALIGFGLGRLGGGRILTRLPGEGVQRLVRLVGANGFLASLIVRLVPSGPFIVVNMAAGMTPMRLRDFAAGTGLGIIPKIVLTALAGVSILGLMKGEARGAWLVLAAIAASWIAVGWFARRWLARRRADSGRGEG